MNIVTKATGDSLTATEFNQIPDELETLISSAGILPISTELDQISKAIAQYSNDGNFYNTVSGTANAIELTNNTRKTPTALTNGLKIRFSPAINNTGATTINVANLGTKSLKFRGKDIPANFLVAGKYYEAIYNSADDIFDLDLFYTNNSVVYNNVADLKADTTLVAGAFCKTKGYYTANDGGEAEYIIREATESDVDNGGSILIISGGNFVAELIIPNGILNVKKFGAKGDNTTDDRQAIQNAIDYMTTVSGLGKTIYFPNGKYLINSSYSRNIVHNKNEGGTIVVIDQHTIQCGIAIEANNIQLVGESPFTEIALGNNLSTGQLNCLLLIRNIGQIAGQKTTKVNLKNLNFQCRYKTQNGIDTEDCYLTLSCFENVSVAQVNNIAINLDCYLFKLDRVDCRACKTGIKIKGTYGGNSTSTLLDQCYVASYTDYAYMIDNGYYTSFNVCCSDNLHPGNAISYYIKTGVAINFSGCGCEGADKVIKVDYADGLTIDGFCAHAVGSADIANPTDFLFDFRDVRSVTLSGIYTKLATTSGTQFYADKLLGLSDINGNPNNNGSITVTDSSFNVTETNRSSGISFANNVSCIGAITQRPYTNNYNCFNDIMSERFMFNSTLFTAHGTAVIDSSGIATGFENNLSSYIELSSFRPKNMPWAIETPFYTFNQISSTANLLLGASNCRFTVGATNAYLFLGSQNDGIADIAELSLLPTQPELNKPYQFKGEFTGTKYVTYYRNSLEEEWKQSSSINSTTPIYDFPASWRIGVQDETHQIDATVDLTTLRMFIFGVETVSGATNGREVVFPKDYTATEGVQIENDQIVTDWGAFSDYIQLPSINLGNKPWIIETPLYKFSDLTHNNTLLAVNSAIRMTAISTQCTMFLGDPNITLKCASQLETNLYYQFKVEYNGENYKGYYRNSLTEDWKLESTRVYSTPISSTALTFKMNGYASNYQMTGIADLSPMLITSANKPIYCPFRQVNFNYLDNGIKICAEAERYKIVGFDDILRYNYVSPSVSKKNVVLPNKSLFEMIGAKTLKYSITTGNTTVNIYNDKTCLITGVVLTAGVINIPISGGLANTNYYCSLPTSAKTKTTFTTASTGDYLLIGEL